MLVSWAILAFSFPLLTQTTSLASYVVADESDNEGRPPGPVDAVCVYTGELSMSASLSITASLLKAHAETSDWVTMPHPLNHSSTVLLDCSDLLANVGKSAGYCRYCKEYAVCRYAKCLKGAEVNDVCCSLVGDTDAMMECSEIALPYNPKTRTLASCEFNYELYTFGSSDGYRPMYTIGVFALVMLLLF